MNFVFEIFNSKDIEEIYKNGTFKKEDVLHYDLVPQTLRPCYLLWVDHSDETIYLFLRGSRSITDVVTDLHASSTPFKTGHCHVGFLKSAKWFDTNLKSLVKETLKSTNYKFKIVGHSLGAAVGSIISIMWKESFDLQCYAFACPSVLSLDLAEMTSDFIFTFVNEFDIVPRLSLFSINELKKQVEDYEKKNQLTTNSWRSVATRV
jgi:predicted lipase